MSSDQRNRVLNESETVAKRMGKSREKSMEKSRKEIELLKVEYEKLLERGLRGTNTSNITDTDKHKQKEIENKREEGGGGRTGIRSVSVCGSGPTKVETTKVTIPIQVKKQSPTPRVVSPKDPKVKHYNVDDARDFIKKQRERWSQQKQLKETDNAVELKKQKLRELHQKSLQIVARNRQRSKSREKMSEVPTPTLVAPLELNAPKVTITQSIKRTQSKPKEADKTNTNITYRIAQKADLSSTNKVNKNTNYVHLSAKSDDAKIKAATLIQAYFRGHIQRKIYQNALQFRMETRRKQLAVEKAKKELEERKIEKIRKEIAEKIREQEVEDAQSASNRIKDLPPWLEIEPNIHPYNFISSVKRKLNAALSMPVKTSDVAIQSSFSRDDKTPQRSSKEVRELIEQNLSSKKSDKEVNQKIEESLKAIRNLQLEEMQEKVAKSQSKSNIDLDCKRLNSLKLKVKSKSDFSDSDTSKNIPDISFESQFNSYHNTCSIISEHPSRMHTSTESVIVFKKPIEAPPKPKRMSRIDSKPLGSQGSSTISSQSPSVSDSMQNGKQSSSTSSSSSTSKSTAKSLPKSDGQNISVNKESSKHSNQDMKLSINLDRLKDIKLQRRLQVLQNPDNTLLDYEPETKSKSISEHVVSTKTSSELRSTSKNQLSANSSNHSSQSGRSSHLSQNEHDYQSTSSINTKISNMSKSLSKSNDLADEEALKGSSKQSRTHSYPKGNSIMSPGTLPGQTLTHPLNDSSKSSIKSQNHSSVPPQYSSNSKRDSIITGNISQYTKSFDSYKASQPLTPVRTGVEDKDGRISEIPEDLNSFRQYMKDLDESSKIVHTPFQPRHQMKNRGANADRLLRQVISKVSKLEHQSKDLVLSTNKTSPEGKDLALPDKRQVHEDEQLHLHNENKSTDKLVAPDVNLIVLKSSDSGIDKDLCGKTSVETIAGSSNQIHVKFEAELHLLNDFNDSLRQIMNIEKSMLDLQTKYHIPPTKSETRDVETSMTQNSKPISKSRSINMSSINLSRGSDYSERDRRVHTTINKQLVLDNNSLMHDNSLLITDNSSFAVSDITLNNTTQEKEPGSEIEVDKQISKLNSAGVSLGMFDQLITDEDARIENLKTVLKIREKALLDRTKSELTWLEIQKKQLLETGKLHEASLLKKKQRGIILKLQEEKNEMQRLKQIRKAASKERKSMLKEQRNLIKAQLASPHTVTKVKRSTKTEHRSSGPVKVYNYQSETSISRKSSISENVVYTSRSESIISKFSDNEIESHKIAIADTATSRTDMAKRSLQIREAALQRRRKEAEDLLKWHQNLLIEEHKIAELEMAASNVINQVPATDNEKYAFKSTQPTLWTGTAGKHHRSLSNSNTNSRTSLASNDTATYSMDFDDRNKESDEDVALGKGIKQSESTLHEIMQNINNITDEISELYKLSSIQSKTVDAKEDQSDAEGSIATEASQSSKASVITTSQNNKISSVPEVSIKSVETHKDSIVSSIIKSKDGLKQSQTTSEIVKDETRGKLKSISDDVLSAKSTSQERNEQTEEDISSIKDQTLKFEEEHRIINKDEQALTFNSESNQIISEQNTALQSVQSKVEDRFINSGEEQTQLQSEVRTETANVDLNKTQVLSSGETLKESIQLEEKECASKISSYESNNLVSSQEVDLEASSNEVITSLKSKFKEDVVPSSKIEECGDKNSLSSEIVDEIILESQVDTQTTDQPKTDTVDLPEILALAQDETDRVSFHDQVSSINDETVFSKVESEPYQSVIHELFSDEKEDVVAVSIESEEAPSFVNYSVIDNELNESIKSEQIEAVADQENKDERVLSETFIVLADESKTLILEIDDEETASLRLETEIDDVAEENKADTTEQLSISSKSIRLSAEGEENDFDHDSSSSKQLKTEIHSLSSTSKSQVSSNPIENALPLPVIGVKLEEKRLHEESDSGSISSSNSNSNSSSNLSEVVKGHTQSSNDDMNETFDDLESIKESPHSIDDEIVYEEEEEESSCTDKQSIDVKKRVSEILADANLNASIEEKSPRLPDIYVTTYDVMSPDNSPELGSPVDSSKPFPKPKDIYGIGNEAQELLKKQLAIEQEIKQIERQQKEQLPYIFVREIPNKPPPPYTPPILQPIVPVQPTSIVPTSSHQIEELAPHLAEIFYKGFVNKTLQYVTFPDLKSDCTDKLCAEFLFDICKDLAIEQYKQFEEVATLSWLKLNKRQNFRRPHTQAGLESMFKKKLNQLFGFEKLVVKESMIIKWSRKKRDHVDELLLVESQAEEVEWTNYDQDELIVKDEVTNSLLDMLIGETANILEDIFTKRRGNLNHC